MTFCVVDYDTRRYQAKEAVDALLNEAIDRRADELMLPGAAFDPLDDDLFDEALSEKLGSGDRTWTASIAKLMRTGNDAGLRIALLDMSREYHREAAENEALKQLENEGDSSY